MKDEKNLRTIKFMDKEGSVFYIDINIYKRGKTGIQLAISGHGGGGSEQNYNEIIPANKTQAQFKSLWAKYQLKNISKETLNKILSVADEIVELEGSKSKSDDWSKIDDDKIVALAKHLELSPEEAELSIKLLDGNRYTVGKDTWLVCTNMEADNEAKDSIINTIDDIGISNFNINISDFINEGWFKDALEESYESYAQDIKIEDDDTYGNRLIQEMYEQNVITDDDFMSDKEGNINYKTLNIDIDDKMEDFVNKLVDNAGDAVEWYKHNFGEEEFNRTVKDNYLVDENKLAEYVVSMDGRGSILNRYDGSEYEETVNDIPYYIYED